jgi:hypothetical protein
MNDEQRAVALFQAQPEGLGLFFRPAALSFAHVVHYTSLILPCWTEKEVQQSLAG